MSSRLAITLAVFCFSITLIKAQDASSLLPPTAKSADVRAAKWEQTQAAVQKGESLKAQRTTPKVLVYRTTIAGQDCALSYLFLGSKASLTNVAYMVKRETTQVETLTALFATLEAELTKLYGKATTIDDEDSTLKPEEIANLKAGKTPGGKELAKMDEKELIELNDAMKDPAKKDAQRTKDLISKFLLNTPSIFYAKYLFWENKRTVIRLDLEMSTDGTGWIHLFYTSKQFAKGAASKNDRAKPFTYSRMDGIKDFIMSQSGEYSEEKMPEPKSAK